MPDFLTEPFYLVAITAGFAGTVLLLQARVQSRMLRRRIATGAGTIVVDPATGLFSAAAAWQCIRGEANRAARLQRPLDVWIGTAEDTAALDARGRELAFELPAGATGIRIDHRHVCLVTCAGATPDVKRDELEWQRLSIPAGDEAAVSALAFISDVTGG